MQQYKTFSMRPNITGNEMKMEQGSGCLEVNISKMKRGG
jgi:hypothetical protein